MGVGLIILLILLGVFFLVVELVFLQGVAVGVILSLTSYAGAIYLGFREYGIKGGITAIVFVAVLSLIATIISLRAKTWRKLALNDKLESVSMDSPEKELMKGDEGVAVSRLAPIGKVNFDGKVFEARSSSGYIDPRRKVRVIGFENFTVIVEIVE
jgi:membrane-bound ClpP family serine protease